MDYGVNHNNRQIDVATMDDEFQQKGADTDVEQDDATFIPQIKPDLVPKVRQEFQSLEDALDFYNKYAREAGFSTRIGNVKKIKETGEIKWKMFVCSNEGRRDEKKIKTIEAPSQKRKRGHTRCGCRAKMTVKKSKDTNMWTVSYFIEGHNHALATPSRVHLLNSHRKISTTRKVLAQQFSDANIPICQQVRLFEIDAGGPSKVGCLERDIRNNKRDADKEIFGHDAETIIQHFEMEKEKNENFFFSYETDDTGVFRRCFWADYESRKSYSYFGDTVVFDTTYNTNKYSMVFAPFIGVNHHRQTVLFGCGLLSDEKAETFNWLFKKFLECMSNRGPPGVIISDQDAAIARAISEVFPGVLHRFCLWHILNKFSDKLNATLYKEKYHILLNIIKESESADEFENQWSHVMNSTELRHNEWLSNMYTIRHRWVPAYVRHIFAAGMSSSQRVESSHSFFKRYLDHKNSLIDFITRFNRALVHQRHEELVANHNDFNEVLVMVTGFPMELKMSSIYTKKIFLLFQKELQESMTYICTLISETNESKVYMVKQFEPEKPFNRQRRLTYQISSDLISCSCQLFEFEGYPCRHMLCWMKVMQVMMLPDKYITLLEIR